MTQPYGQPPQSGPPQPGPAGQPSPYVQQPEYVRGPNSRFNVAGGVLAAIAAVLGALALFVLGWFRDDYSSVSGGKGSSSDSTFSKLHDALAAAKDQLDAQPTVSKFVHFGISPIYFGWLGYLLIAAAVVFAFAAAAPLGRASGLVRGLCALIALAGFGLSLWAFDLLHVDAQLAKQLNGGDKPPSYFEYLKHTSFGAWAMLLAFVLCFIVALMGPKRTAGSAVRY